MKYVPIVIHQLRTVEADFDDIFCECLNGSLDPTRGGA